MKDIIIGVAMVILFTIAFFIGKYNGTTTVIDNSKLDSIQVKYNELKIEYDILVLTTDSLIKISNSKLDSIQTVKNNIIYSYERRIKEINDATIVSNDSVTRFISSRISNR